jgi:hypothetical protein
MTNEDRFHEKNKSPLTKAPSLARSRSGSDKTASQQVVASKACPDTGAARATGDPEQVSCMAFSSSGQYFCGGLLNGGRGGCWS